jgi:hypothetical protein
VQDTWWCLIEAYGNSWFLHLLVVDGFIPNGWKNG